MFGICLLALAILPNPASAQAVTGIAAGLEPYEEPFPISHKDLNGVPEQYHRQEVSYLSKHPPGTLVVDTANRYLYLILDEGRALRYGIGVGRQGFEWAGVAEVGRKAPWPRWVPPKDMVARDSFAAKWAGGMPGGPKNPLGARALYLHAKGVDTLYRIHGTNQPSSIGQAVSSGCVRLLNVDIIDLYQRVDVGAKVVVLERPSEGTVVARSAEPQRKVRKAKIVVAQKAWKPRLPRNPVVATSRDARALKIVRKTNFNLPGSRLASR